MRESGRLLVLGLLLLLVGCGEAPPAGLRAKPDKPQEKIKAQEVATERLVMLGGEPGMLVQEAHDGLVLRTPVETLLHRGKDAPMVLTNKRLPPRVAQAVIEGTRIRLPGPAEADRVLLTVGETTELLTVEVPRPPPAGSAPVEPEEGIVVRTTGQVRTPQGMPVRWDAGYRAAAGLALPGWLVPNAYYRLEFDGTGWVLVAMTALGPPAP